MRADSLSGRVVATLSRRSPAFQPPARPDAAPAPSQTWAQAVQVRLDAAARRSSRTAPLSKTGPVLPGLLLLLGIGAAGTTAVAVHLGSLTAGLGVPGQWILPASALWLGLLVGMLLTPLIASPRRLWQAGLVLGLAGSLGALAVDGLWELAACLLVLSVGEVCIGTGAYTAVFSSASRTERGRLLDRIGLAMSAGAVLGPLTGALLVQHAPVPGLPGWRSVFLVMAAASAAGFLPAGHLPHEPQAARREDLRPYWRTAVLVLLLGAAATAAQYGSLTGVLGLLLCLGAALLWAWMTARRAVREGRRDTGLLGRPVSARVLTAFGAAAVTGPAVVLCLVLVPFTLATTAHASLLTVGLVLTPLPAGLLAGARTAALLLTPRGKRVKAVVIAGLALTGVGAATLASPWLTDSPAPLYAVPLSLVGLGAGAVGSNLGVLLHEVGLGSLGAAMAAVQQTRLVASCAALATVAVTAPATGLLLCGILAGAGLLTTLFWRDGPETAEHEDLVPEPAPYV
ncbi:MFS transporter [Streptomyces sp. NPDC048606]|uniref:MFS transporter n=1 Tax=Streptomyces sp. NPDC048606 TaxID=3154726 RepID=UPI00343C9CFD